MGKKKKILFINQTQFGYHVDYYYYAISLKKDYEVSYVAWDNGFDKIEGRNVNLIYIKRDGNKLQRILRYALLVLKNIINNDIIFINYFIGASFIRLLFPNKCNVLDIRSVSVQKSSLKRIFKNGLIRLESYVFRKVTTISYETAKKLKLNLKTVDVIPLGGEIFDTSIKQFDKINILYVGTFHNRNILETIKGFDYYFQQNKQSKIEITYTIIGYGYNKEEKIITEAINKIRNSRIRYVGRVKYTDLPKYFKQHNVGLSYVPITEYFNDQPPTKTLEYLLSGMPVLATATKANSELVKKETGVIINDGYMDISRGIDK